MMKKLLALVLCLTLLVTCALAEFSVEDNIFDDEYREKNARKNMSDEQLAEIYDFADEYKAFISACKTERETVKESIRLAEEKGFVNLDKVEGELKAGDKVYVNWMNKSFMAFIIGNKPMSEGMRILGAHIDSPRIDLKTRPFHENSGFAYLDTEYYGGTRSISG